MLRVIACGVLLWGLTGCFRMSVRTGAPRDGLPEARTGVSLVYGLSTANVSASECRHGVSRVDVYWPWWGAFVYVGTVGFVTPLRTEYVCAEATPATRAVPEQEQVPDSIAPL